MNEWHIILSVGISAVLFASGGTKIKALRRYGIPLSLGIIGSLYATWWQVLAYALTLSMFLHMGYGDRCPWWRRALIFTGYGVSALWLGFTWWAIITPSLCMGMFLLSNVKATEKIFQWKFCELAMGFLIGVTFCSALK